MGFLNKRELKHSVKLTVRQFIYLPCILTLIMLLLIPGANVFFSNSSFHRMGKFAENVGAENFFGFSLYDGNNIAKFIPYVLLGLGIITAYLLFRFLFSKKAQAVYFLTGVSRGQLFLIRYLYGVISLVLAVFLAMAVSVVMNIAAAGVAEYLFANAVYLFLSMFSMAYFCYSVCVALMIISGRGIDYFLSAAGVWSAGLLVLLFIQNVFYAFLPGAPYAFGKGNPQAHHYPTIFDKYSYLSFADSFKETIATCGTVAGLKGGTDLDYAVERMVKEPWMILLLCCLGAVFGLVGWILLKKRRAELAEKPNANRVITNAVSIIVPMSLASCVFLYGRTLLHVLAFVFLLIVGYCILYAIFNGTVRRIQKALPVPVTASLLGCALCLICFFGGVGYSSYVPDVDDIQSVQITYPGHPQYAAIGGMFDSDIYSTEARSPYYYHHDTPDRGTVLTEKADIETAVGIHRMLIADGSRSVTEENLEDYGENVVYANIYVTYTLKNGREITRFYRTLKMSSIESMLELELTDGYQALLESRLKYFGEDSGVYDSTNEAALDGIFSESAVYAADNLFSNLTLLSLTNEEKAELIDAILRDKSDDTVSERYHPEKECLGVLIVTSHPVELMSSDGFYDMDYGIYHMDGVNHIYVYDEDIETLSYLREHGFYEAFEKECIVTKMEIYDFPLYPSREWQKLQPYNRCFYARVNSALILEVGDFVREVPSEEFEEILQKTRLTYFTNGGDLVVIRTVNADGEERVVTKYLPRES